MNRHFTKEDAEMANKEMIQCSNHYPLEKHTYQSGKNKK
jgi:hypothetical protein